MKALGPFVLFCRSETHQEKSFAELHSTIARVELLLQQVGVSSKDHATLGQLSADDTSYSGEDGKEEQTTKSDMQPCYPGSLGVPSSKLKRSHAAL